MSRPMFLRSTIGIRSTSCIYLAGKFSGQPLGRTIKILLDSGAELNLVSTELLDEVNQEYHPAHPGEFTRAAGGLFVPNRGWIELPIFSGQLMFNGLFAVQDSGPNRTYDMVLGMPWFAEVSPIIDWSIRTVDVCDDEELLVRLPVWDEAQAAAGQYEPEVIGFEETAGFQLVLEQTERPHRINLNDSYTYNDLIDHMDGSWLE